MSRRPVTCGQADAMLWLAGGLAFLGGCAVIAWAVTR